MPVSDPRLDALIKAFPNKTPAELIDYLYGHKGDIALPPSAPRTLGDLARAAFARVNPLEPVTRRLREAGKK